MDLRKKALIIVISLVIGGLITYWLYVKFHVLFFIVFIPFFGLGGRLIARMFTLRGDDSLSQNGRSNNQKDRHYPEDDRFLPGGGGYLPPGDEEPDERLDERQKV